MDMIDQDCAVCKEKLNHPAKLPCDHVFCFLCIKGAILKNHKCPMCRTETLEDYLHNPVLVNELVNEEEPPDLVTDKYQWYYEGKDGWWSYDERSNEDLEENYNSGKSECKNLLLAGSLYCVDFTKMYQYCQSDPRRTRKVKRDTNKLPTKGIAGIRNPNSKTAENIDDNSTLANVNITTTENSDEISNDIEILASSMRSINLEDHSLPSSTED